MQTLRASSADRKAEREETRHTNLAEWGGRRDPWTTYDEDTLRCRQSPRSQRSAHEPILLCGILFSPRSLLPGQMHTNAFRSPKDKEWTRFSRGSNVSLHIFGLYMWRVLWPLFVHLSSFTNYTDVVNEGMVVEYRVFALSIKDALFCTLPFLFFESYTLHFVPWGVC